MMRNMILYLVTVMALMITLAGCNSGPSKETVTELVKSGLKEYVPDPMMKNRWAQQKASIVEECRVLSIGEEAEYKTMGKKIKYWPCRVYAKGQCVKHKLLKRESSFEGEYNFFIHKNNLNNDWNINMFLSDQLN